MPFLRKGARTGAAHVEGERELQAALRHRRVHGARRVAHREEARQKLVMLLRKAALPPPPPRKATKPTAGSKARCLE